MPDIVRRSDVTAGDARRLVEVRSGEFAPEVVVAARPGGGGLPVTASRSTVDVLTSTGLNVSTSGATAWFDVSALDELGVICDLTSISGVGAGVTFRLERAYGATNKATEVWAAAQLTAVGVVSQSVGAGLQTPRTLGRLMRVAWTSATGTTASADLFAIGK